MVLKSFYMYDFIKCAETRFNCAVFFAFGVTFGGAYPIIILGMARKSDQDSPIPFIDEDDEANEMVNTGLADRPGGTSSPKPRP